jgi:polysaccharide pyruvyl transferase WcaK-like protein
VVARDPLSRSRLERACGRAVIGGADLAFLLDPAADSAVLDSWRPWLAAERAAGRLLIGVNANLLVAGDGETLAGRYAEGLARCHAEHGPLSLALLPHDRRPMPGGLDDLALLAAIADRLPPELAAHARLLSEPASAAELKALAGATDLVLSGRMHLAIAALGMGVPAGGVVYQGKFEGLYQHLGLAGLCLPPTALLRGGELAPFLAGMIARREELAAAIAARLPAVRDLSRRNFDDLPPPRKDGG